VIQSLKYEPSPEPLRQVFLPDMDLGSPVATCVPVFCRSGLFPPGFAPAGGLLYFFFALVTGPRRSLSLELSDTKVYEPQTRARLGITSHFCEVVVLQPGDEG